MRQKEIIPNDTAFNKLYPFPNSLSKKIATAILILILIIFILITLTTLSGQ